MAADGAIGWQFGLNELRGSFLEQIVKWPDLSSRPDSALEWWFVQGVLHGERMGRLEFMLSLFRQSGKSGRDGHMLLASTLDPADGRYAVVSQVTPQLVDNFLRETRDEVRDLDFDQRIVDAMLSEIAAGGPPGSIRLETEPVELASAPFRAKWKDVVLCDAGNLLQVAFQLPGDGRCCQFEAHPEASWFVGRDLGQGPVGTMSYDSCPRLSLEGSVDGEPVHGLAWIDHQWGGYGWLRAQGSGSGILGWNWFGINLDDGMDLILMVHRDMESRVPVSSFAIVFEAGRRPRQVGDVVLTSTGEWRSSASMADYPIRWHIGVPAIDAELEFLPAATDQEIPVFGLINAIWEGAGTIRGTIGGRPVGGRARLELHGYGHVFDFKNYQRKWIERIDRHIAEFLPQTLDQEQLEIYVGAPRWAYDPEAQTRMLAEPVWDLVSRGGKHWRPIFGLLLLGALGVEVERYEQMIAAIAELVHNGSVIVDDIEDSSVTRRGDPTIHLRYGLPTALNTGNTLYFLPLLTIARNRYLSAGKRDAIYRTIVEMFVQAHFGQAQDLYWSKLEPDRSRQLLVDPRIGATILQAHAFKSAAAVRATADVATIIADAPAETRTACSRLSESWGVAFQMIDDVNNFSTSPQWGKRRAEDVAEGKYSYVVHQAVQLLAGDRRERLLDILTDSALRNSEQGLAEAIQLIEASGAFEAVRLEAKNMVESDWPAFSRSLPSSRSKIMLRVLLTTLLDLPFEM